MDSTPQRPILGIFWMIVTGLCFVAVTVLVKYVGPRLPAAEAGCWTGRLRSQYDRLCGTTEEGSDERVALAAMGVTLSGLEVLEQRAVFSADRTLRRAVALRAAELGRALSEAALEQLGYYALPAVEPTQAHNELPTPALAARDAMAELIRYLDAGPSMSRNDLAQRLGLTGE